MSEFQDEVGALVTLRLRGHPPGGLPSDRCAWLRGAIADRLRADVAFHGHGKTGPVYQYPRVQYRWFTEEPQILLIGDTTETLIRDRLPGSELILNGTPMRVEETLWSPLRFSLAPSSKLIRYRFVSPWLALSQENHARYLQSDERSRRALLDKILIGNLLAMFTGFGWRLDPSERIYAAFESTQVVSTRLKSVGLMAFDGSFVTNWSLPVEVALGRSVSRGFGATALY